MQVNQSQSQNDLAPTDSDQTHCKNVRIILSHLLWISSNSPKKLFKVGLKLLGWVWVDQLEIKDTCIEFVINNVSVQGNNYVRIKLNMKVEKICRDCSSNFLRNTPGFCLV